MECPSNVVRSFHHIIKNICHVERIFYPCGDNILHVWQEYFKKKCSLVSWTCARRLTAHAHRLTTHTHTHTIYTSTVSFWFTNPVARQNLEDTYFELVVECLMAEECTWSMATFAGFILSLFGSKIKATSLHFPTKIEIDVIQGAWCHVLILQVLGIPPISSFMPPY